MKKRSIIFLCIIALTLFAIGVQNTEARSSFWAGQGGCSACHIDDATSCAGCHAHGVHSDNSKSDINVLASTDKATYSPGEMVTVSITGGYRPGWVRAILYDENGVEVARSQGPGCGSGGLDNGCGGGLEFPGPILLMAPAPMMPGTYMWEASWYGNEYDLGNIGGTTFFGPGWTPDPNNPNHGEEIVMTNGFDVVAAGECGDGILDPATEDCDDGAANGTTLCGCQIDCTYTPAGTVCGDQGLECLVEDTCDGMGACTDNGFQPDGTACGDPSNSECDNPDTCLAGTCQDNNATAATACGDQGIECLVDDSCDGAGACTDNGSEPDGTVCGDPADTDCNNPDSCLTGACEPNYEPAGVICEDGEFCTVGDTCTGMGMCMGGIDSPCLPGEACDEVNDICEPPDLCGNGQNDPNELCDPSVEGTVCCEADCTYSSSTTACGDPSVSECDNADTCAGDAAVCNPNYATAGTACGDQGIECLVDDSCDGVGACTDNGSEPDGTLCGDSSDTDCDNPDSCLTGACEPNYESAGVICEDGEFCTVGDTCTGMGMCMGGVDSPCLPDETCDDVNDVCVPPVEADVSLEKMRAPKSLKIRPNVTVSKSITAVDDADTKDQNATTTLSWTMNPMGLVTITVTPSTSIIDLVSPGNGGTQFKFSADITCNASGTAGMIMWIATIDAPENRDSTNDVVTATTNVTCR